jgi:hypothetical protein
LEFHPQPARQFVFGGIAATFVVFGVIIPSLIGVAWGDG